MKIVSFLNWFCHLLRIFLSLFSDLGFASVVKGSPDPNKVQEGRKTLKNGVQKGHHFHKNSQFFVMFFSLVFGGVLGSVFLRFGSRNGPNGGYLGALFQLCCSKAGKLKFVYTKHYFCEFWGARSGRLAQLFPTSFLGWVLRRDFTIFWEIEGPAVAPKTTFGGHFRYKFYVDFWWIFKGTPNPESGKGGWWLGGFWGPNKLITDHWRQTSNQKPHERWMLINKRKPKPQTDSWNVAEDKLVSDLRSLMAPL